MAVAAKVRAGLEKIYGSAARDELTPDSDIDIAVVLGKGIRRGLRKLCE